jgi:hypothetical protein
MRWHYCDPPLLWLFPVSYAIHIAEEHAFGFTHWAARHLGSTMSARTLLGSNAFGLVLMIAGVRLASRNSRHAWIAVALATAVLLNALGHVAGTLASGAYSPGLLTSVVMWLPLGLLTLVRAIYQASRRTLAVGTSVGVAIQAVVTIVAAGLL